MSLYFKAFYCHECYNHAMQSALKKQQKQDGYEGLSASQLLAVLTEKDELLQAHQKHLKDNAHVILEQGKRISLLEEYLRLAKIQKFGASSEKLAFQSDLFDEAEIEVALSELEEQLPEGRPGSAPKEETPARLLTGKLQTGADPPSSLNRRKKKEGACQRPFL